MKQNILITLLLISVLVQLSGCSYAPYPADDISKNPSLVHIDANNPRFFGKITIINADGQENTITIRKEVIPKLELGANKTFSLKYDSAPNVRIPVEFPNRCRYAAFLDSGFSGYILLTSDVVLENKFAISPISSNSTIQGICHIPAFNVGTAGVKDAAGFYWEKQMQFRILNIPIKKYSVILLGVQFIKTFDYVLFDNVGQEVVFSKDGAFKPDNPQLWDSFPFSIKPDSSSNERIIVQIPIAGRMFEIGFDSCGAVPGLNISKSDWQVIEPKLTVTGLRNTHGISGQSGRVSFQKATVSQLTIGEKTLKNAQIHIFNEPEYVSMISLGYFQDTVVVLDFVNSLMWIKK
jgi:hypothetical protein